MGADPRDERLLRTFLDLVVIDSPTGEEAAVAAYCVTALESAGCEVSLDDSQHVTGANVGNLVAVLPGTTASVLELSAHMDCVMPCRGVEPYIEDRIVRSAGETVLGADDKAGLAAAIECVRRLSEDGGPRPTVRLIFSVSEEIGLVGAKALMPESVVADLCLVLDAHGSPGGIVIASPTHYTFRAEFTGKAAHAGVEPEVGVSAIRIASDAVISMPNGRLDPETTANVGTIEGGVATNVVPERVVITGECRSIDPVRVEEVREAMDAAVRESTERGGGAVEIAWRREYTGFRLSDHDPAVQLVMAACRDVGVEPDTYATGGGSDANIIAELGIPTVALGCGMADVHSTSESLPVADLELLTRLLLAVARRMTGG
jgi:tripeptide aminopeptidase